MMTTFFYQFSDGYFFYNAGRLSKTDLAWEVRQHGALVVERVA